MLLQCLWEDKMEILDLYDKDKKITNLQISRGVKVPKGYYRLVVHICIFNNKGEMLIQKRASYKKWGDKWDISVGGCVSAGETSDVAAMREVKEEIGLDIDLKDKRCNFTFTFEDGFDDIYNINCICDITDDFVHWFIYHWRFIFSCFSYGFAIYAIHGLCKILHAD